MELRQLEHFVAVADERHFTRAAAKVHLAQSSLSSSIAALERELGTELLVRSSRKVELTEAGRALLPAARRSLEAARDGQDAVTAVRGVLRGRLRVGTIQALGGIPLTRWLADFNKHHPEVRLRVHHDAVSSLIHSVVSGDLDIAVVDRPFDKAHLHERPLVAQSLVLAVNHRDPLARLRRVRLSDLADRQFAEYRSDSALRARIDVACEEAGLYRRSIFEADTIGDLLSAVEHGIGVALVPPETMVGHPHLRTVNTEPEIGRELVMVYAANRPPSPPTDRFLSIIEHSLPERR
jgi:DNA-binding transcriptional LysR family regulator